MKYSLVSRDIIADSIECVMKAQHYDGIICIPGCDKNLPGSAIALARLNRPGFIIYGGSMKPNFYNNTYLDIVSAFKLNLDIAEFSAANVPPSGWLKSTTP